MTSHRRRQDRPIESIVLRIRFKANRKEIARIREAVPSAVMRRGACEVRIEADRPADVAAKAKELLEKLRTVV